MLEMFPIFYKICYNITKMTKQFYNNTILLQPPCPVGSRMLSFGVSLNYERDRINKTRQVLVFINFFLKHQLMAFFVFFKNNFLKKVATN